MSRTATTEKRDIHQEVTDRIVKALEDGVVPWQKPWSVARPMSMSTGKPYRGINVWLLALTPDFPSNYWGTYKKISELGGQVRKGEKSTMITFWKRLSFPDLDANGAKQYVDGKLKMKDIMMLRAFNVFNATQADWAEGMPEKFTPKAGLIDHQPIDAAEAILRGYLKSKGAPYMNEGWDAACYVPFTDQIQMPDRNTFRSPELYYSVAFHESTHSTGHADRLNRPGVANFDSFASHQYGTEELVAEMGSAMLCAIAGVLTEDVFENSASYLAHWVEVIKGSPKMIVQAAGQASKAVDLITGEKYEPEKEATD